MPVRYFPSYSPTPEPPKTASHKKKATALSYVLIAAVLLGAAYGFLTDPALPVWKYLVLTSLASLSSEDKQLLPTALELLLPLPNFVRFGHAVVALLRRRTVALRAAPVVLSAVLLAVSVVEMGVFVAEAAGAVLDGPGWGVGNVAW